MELKYIIIIAVAAFILLVLFGLAIVNYSFDEMVDQYKRNADVYVSTTPIELALKVNAKYFRNSIRIKYSDKYFSDCFSGNGVLTLSSKYANEKNIAGLAICAHELGHAFQFRDEKKRMTKHFRRLKISKLFSHLISPSIIAGIVCIIISYLYIGLGLIGFGAFCLIIALFAKISTLNLEKDASNTALNLLMEFAFLTDSELEVAKKFLDSAKQTYVADVLKIVLKWTMFVKK